MPAILLAGVGICLTDARVLHIVSLIATVVGGMRTLDPNFLLN